MPPPCKVREILTTTRMLYLVPRYKSQAPSQVRTSGQELFILSLTLLTSFHLSNLSIGKISRRPNCPTRLHHTRIGPPPAPSGDTAKRRPNFTVQGPNRSPRTTFPQWALHVGSLRRLSALAKRSHKKTPAPSIINQPSRLTSRQSLLTPLKQLP